MRTEGVAFPGDQSEDGLQREVELPFHIAFPLHYAQPHSQVAATSW